jgi:hypothetical protein
MAQQPPLMNDELSATERAALAALIQQPGWSVVEKMHMSACRKATEDTIKLADPLEQGYERKLVALQQRARERNEFSLLILGSVHWHVKALAVEQEEKEQPAENPIVRQLYEVKNSK